MRIVYIWVQWAAGVDVGSHGRMVKWNDMIVTVICEIWTHYHAKLLTQQKAKGLVVQPPSQLLWLITARRIETCFSGHVHLQRIEAWTASNWVTEWVTDWEKSSSLCRPDQSTQLIHMHILFSITLMDISIHPFSTEYGLGGRWDVTYHYDSWETHWSYWWWCWWYT